MLPLKMLHSTSNYNGFISPVPLLVWVELSHGVWTVELEWIPDWMVVFSRFFGGDLDLQPAG